MPQPGMRWRHVVISTHNSWLPGDPRGFRAKNHKIHSSGDYKNPPPEGEHSGLNHYAKNISGAPVIIRHDQREKAGRAILKKLQKLNLRILALSVSATHSHWLAELPADIRKVRAIAGQCKTASSHAIRDKLPGQVWGHRGKFKPIDEPEYQKRVYRYILNQKDAWIWSFRAPPSPRASNASPGGSSKEP